MSELPGDRSDLFLGRLRDISRLASEQELSHQNSTDSPRHQSVPNERLTTRRDFFRYSNRQCMILISTLSLCFAVNRHNHVDDLLFVLKSIMSPTFLWILLIPVALLIMARAYRKSKRVTTTR